MHKYDRKKILIRKLEEKEFTSTKDLISYVKESYDFTAITVRRDLKEIAKTGQIKLMHGGIKYIKKNKVNKPNLDIDREKIDLANKANGLIDYNDILFINSGAINEYIISTIDKPVHVFTNSIDIFKQSIQNENILDTILIGGRYIHDNKVLVGTYSLANLENLKFSKCILNAHNVSNTYDLYTRNDEEAKINEKVLNLSAKKIIIAEKESLNTIGCVKYGNLNFCDIFITNNKLLPDINIGEWNNNIVMIN